MPVPDFRNMKGPVPPGELLDAIRCFMELVRFSNDVRVKNESHRQVLDQFCIFVDDINVWGIATSVIYELDE